MHFSKEVKAASRQGSSAFFGVWLRLHAFFICEDISMTFQQDKYEEFSNAHEVTAELVRALESLLISGERDKQILHILAAAYTVTDCLASCIGTMGIDDTEFPELEERTPSHYRQAAETMGKLIDIFKGELCCAAPHPTVDYRSVQWVSALITWSEYLSEYLS